MRISWTGKGWLAFVIIAATMVVGALLAVPLTSATSLGAGAVLGTMAAAFALSAFPSYLLGRALNSSVGVDGRRVWHNSHCFGTSALFGTGSALLPLQNVWVGDLGIAWLTLAVFVGGVLLNSPVLVWVLWLLPVVGGVVTVIILRRRRKAAAWARVPTPDELEQIRSRVRRATQAIRAGETLRFGDMSVSSTGLECDGRVLPFRDIERIHYDRDNLYCQLPTGTYTCPLSRIDDASVATGVAIGFHRATTGRA